MQQTYLALDIDKPVHRRLRRHRCYRRVCVCVCVCGERCYCYSVVFLVQLF